MTDEQQDQGSSGRTQAWELLGFKFSCEEIPSHGFSGLPGEVLGSSPFPTTIFCFYARMSQNQRKTRSLIIEI